MNDVTLHNKYLNCFLGGNMNENMDILMLILAVRLFDF